MMKSKQNTEFDAPIPERFFCKINLGEIMSAPVIAPDGYTYERETIEAALLLNPVSPMTREEIDISKLKFIPNRDLKSEIQEYLVHHPEHCNEVYLSKASKQQLFKAIQDNERTVIDKLLLDKRLLTMPLTDNKLTALHVACETKHIDLVVSLIKKLGDNVHSVWQQKPYADWSAKGVLAVLVDLIKAKDTLHFKTLFEEGIHKVFDPQSINPVELNLLNIALATGDETMVNQVLAVGCDAWQAVDNKGRLSLHYAVLSKNEILVERCLAQIRALDQQDNENGWSPLFYAIQASKTILVKRLLAQGASVTLKDKQGREPLHYAVSHPDNSEIITLLLEQGADISAVDAARRQPIHWAAEKGNIAFIERFPAGAANLTAADAVGSHALHYAAEAGQVKIIQRLLTLGVDVQAKDKNGKTAEQIAEQHQQVLASAAIREHRQAGQRLLQAIAREDVEQIRSLINQYPHLIYEKLSKGKTIYELVAERNNHPLTILMQTLLGKKGLAQLQSSPKKLTDRLRFNTLTAAITRLDFPLINWCLQGDIDFEEVLETISSRSNSFEIIRSTPNSKYTTYSALLTKGKIVSGFSDGTLKIWDSETGACLTTLLGHTNSIKAIHALPEGKIVSASDDTLKIWDSETGACLTTLSDHTKNIQAIQVLPEGKIVLEYYSSRELKIFDSETGACLTTTLSSSLSYNVAMHVLPKGKIVSVCEGYSSGYTILKIWDLKTGTCLTTLSGHTEEITAIHVLPEGKIVSGSKDGTLKIWDSETGACLTTLSIATRDTTALNALPKGKIVSGSKDGTLKIWDSETGACLTTLSNLLCRSKVVKAIHVLPEGRLITMGETINIIGNDNYLQRRNLLSHYLGTQENAGRAYARLFEDLPNVNKPNHLLNYCLMGAMAQATFTTPQQAHALLELLQLNISGQDGFKQVLLHLSAYYGNNLLLELLLLQGIPIDLQIKDIGPGKTTLHYAAMANQVDTVSYLLSQGANIEAMDKAGNRALHFAAQQGNELTVRYLLKQDAMMDVYNNDKQTPKHLATEKGWLTVAAMLEPSYRLQLQQAQMLRLLLMLTEREDKIKPKPSQVNTESNQLSRFSATTASSQFFTQPRPLAEVKNSTDMEQDNNQKKNSL